MVVGRGVAQVQGHRVLAVFLLYLVQPLGSFVQGVLPADRHPAIGGTLDRVAQAVRVVVQIL